MILQQLQNQDNIIRELNKHIKDLESGGPDAQKVKSKLFFCINKYACLEAFRYEVYFLYSQRNALM
jgi:hypothetical protein